jgi:hypothetical protein
MKLLHMTKGKGRRNVASQTELLSMFLKRSEKKDSLVFSIYFYENYALVMSIASTV